MSRPYLSWSIDQLEAEFQRAQDDGDKQAVERLADELGIHTSARSQKLRQDVARFLGVTVEVRGTVNCGERPRQTANPQSEPRPQSKPRSRLNPTDEQQEAIDLFAKGGSLKINAFAGSGKTSTLEMLAHKTQRQGQYIAFNKAVVSEAREKFPSSVNCSTIHGLAFKATPTKYKSNRDKMMGKMNAHKLADILKLKRWQIDNKHTLEPRSQGWLVLATLRHFMHSADAEPIAAHVPRHGSLTAAPEATLKAVSEFALHAAKHVWGRMKDENDPIPLGHDGYLKLWAQSEPQIGADFILLDEAQDSNPVVLDVLLKQPTQMIYVGDKYQQIYEWRGAVNAMERINTDSSTYLTMSFRFGARIAEAASKVLVLLGERRSIVGNPKVDSRIGPVAPETILARTNASTITAIIEALDAGKTPHLVGGTDELMEMLRGVKDLKEGKQSTVPDFFGFDNWQEVLAFVKSGEGEHLQTFVNLVETRGERQLLWALNRTVDAEKSDIVISTAHKAKGREWKTVQLMDDFMRSRPDEKKSKDNDLAELRLFYVALTRAKEVIDVPASGLSLIGVGANLS